MAGMIGMAQTLGVYHYGYFTLKGRDIQYHGPSKYPSDKSAILDWGLVDPFISQRPLLMTRVTSLQLRIVHLIPDAAEDPSEDEHRECG